LADNKRIAAVAAALASIEVQSAEAAAVDAARKGTPERFVHGSSTTPSPWALYGRQRIMNMRALMQRRGSSRRV
jgi:hypothetical protein